MMTLLNIALLLISLQTDPSIQKIEDREIIKLLHSIEKKPYYQTDELSLSIFKKQNPPGSAGIDGGHEISHSYYFAISEFDEYPVQSLFLIGDFYNPDLKVKEKEIFIEVQVEFGAFDNRRKHTYKVELHQVTLLQE